MATAVTQTEAARWDAALNRAIDAASDVLIEPLSGSAFVESSRNPGVLYLVTAESCTCPAGGHGGICKHRAIYLAMIGELPVEAEAETLPADCLACCGCGVQSFRSYDLPCPDCGGSGIRPDRRPQGQPGVEIAA